MIYVQIQFKAKEQFWNGVFRTITIFQTNEKYYLTHDQDLAFFLFCLSFCFAYTYSYWFFTYMGYVFSKLYTFFYKQSIFDPRPVKLFRFF